MSVKFFWFGPSARVLVRKAAAMRVKQVTDMLYDILLLRVSKQGPPPSSPGQYPKLVTGYFKGTLQKEFSAVKLEGRVGSNDKRAKYLELGTSRMAPRPWLTLLIAESKGKLKKVVLSRRGKAL